VLPFVSVYYIVYEICLDNLTLG